MVTWQKWKAKLEDIFAAVAYAEASDHSTARQMAPFTTPSRRRARVKQVELANFLRDVGLEGVRFRYGVAQV